MPARRNDYYYRQLRKLPREAEVPDTLREEYIDVVTRAETLRQIRALLPVPTNGQHPFYEELVNDALETFLFGENNPEWPVVEYVLSLGVSEEELTFIFERLFHEYDLESSIEFIDDYVASGFRTMALMDGLWQADIDEPAEILQHLYDRYEVFDSYGRYRALQIYTSAYDEDTLVSENDEEMIMGIVQLGFNDPGGFLIFAVGYSTPEYDLLTPTFNHFEHSYRNTMIRLINRDNVDALFVYLRDTESNLYALIAGVLRRPVQYREFIPRLFRFLDHHVEHTLPQLSRIFPHLSHTVPTTGGWFIHGYSEDRLMSLLRSVALCGVGYNGLKLLVDRGARVDQIVMESYVQDENRYDAFLLIPNDFWGEALKRYVISHYPDVQRRVAEEMVPQVTHVRMGDLNDYITQFLG